jgi:hypothetical protein
MLIMYWASEMVGTKAAAAVTHETNDAIRSLFMVL